MRIVRFQTADGSISLGTQEGDLIYPAAGDLQSLHPGTERLAADTVKLLAPVQPSKLLCVGLNYRDHAAEAGVSVPAEPLIFTKLPSCVIGPDAPIELPSISEQVDYEAELAVVIGRRTKGVSTARALHSVAGYTCLNDVSARDLQFGDGQWTRGKSLDTFGPMGPAIVTPDELPDPEALGIRCWVGSELVQDSCTAQMVFGVAELISYISQGITLEPGDVIATGTPPGVGVAREPQRFLREGDVVTVGIDGIGALSNPCIATIGAVSLPRVDRCGRGGHGQ